MVYYRPANRRARIPPRITMHRITIYRSRRQECLSASVNNIAPIIDLVKGTNMHLPGTNLEGPGVTGMML